MSRETSLGVATVRQLCRAFRISRQAYYASRRPPRVTPRAVKRPKVTGCTPTAVLEPRIREIVDANKAWGVRKVWATLRRAGFRVSCKRVWALMRAWGLTLPPTAEREGPAIRGQVAVPESNRRWGTDLTTTWTRLDGVVAIVPVIDCGDRYALACDVTKSQESPSVLAPVDRSLEEVFGDPRDVPYGLELRSDHGPQYTGSDCEHLCDTWGLDHTLAPIGRPTGNAVTERFIETLKVELIWTRDWESADELRLAIAPWLDLYNHRRPHQALGWMTPAEKRALNLGAPQKAAA
jgi:putative transposase